MHTLLLINCGSQKTPLIGACLQHEGATFTEVSLAELAAFNLPKKQYQGVVISGAPILLTQPQNLELVKHFGPLLLLEVPILGICFGHQVLGLLHGAHVFLGVPCRTEQPVELHTASPIFSGFELGSHVFSEDHTEGIDLPASFTCLASSTHYAVEAMEHHSKPYYGVQFHPETSGENGKAIFRNFMAIVRQKASANAPSYSLFGQ